MTEVRLSVVIPVLNEAAILGACLDALARQSAFIDEIIVVDNSSTDATVAVAEAYPRVRVLAESRRGVTFARNTGFDAATGDILARIDADTLVRPGWAQAIRDAFAATPAPAGLAGPAAFTILSTPDLPVGRTPYALFRVIHRVLIGEGPLTYGHNMAITRSAWHRIRELVTVGDNAISEDIDIALALLHTGNKVAYEQRMLVTITAERTMHPAKLARYIRADRLTKAKYRELRAVGRTAAA